MRLRNQKDVLTQLLLEKQLKLIKHFLTCRKAIKSAIIVR